jgi:uroporphyrinogen-III synthase
MGIENIPPIYLLSPTPKSGVRHLPMIKFETIPQDIEFNKFDGLIITSKQGVIALDEISCGKWKTLPVAAIGESTAKEVQKRGGEVIFIASSAYGDVLARELALNFKGFRWLYPRPKVVVSKVAADLRSSGIEVEEKIIYETSCVEYDNSSKPCSGAILIFTSPSIVKCFFQNFSWDISYKAVAIGKKTAESFPKHIDVNISPNTSINEAIEYSRSLL